MKRNFLELQVYASTRNIMKPYETGSATVALPHEEELLGNKAGQIQARLGDLRP